ncbi:hypothetical protein ACFSC4_26520 [Deinococcus malanensis]|uniref:hypothetical protein n=1 Tax=Deinococcus malanensis TaxID=1706855 RepID=UPI00362A1F0C
MIPQAFRWLLAGWLLAALAGTLGLYLMTRSDLHERFDLDARVLHRMLSQRMEQQEAVLRSVDALWQQQVGPLTLGRFAGVLLAPYPQVTAVEECAGTSCRSVTAGHSRLPPLPGHARGPNRGVARDRRPTLRPGSPAGARVDRR